MALWSVVTACNLFKPYTIDDTAYLEIARWITAHPLHPMSGLFNWQGIDEPIYRINQPHLYFYLIAFWGKLFGYSEPAMHALQSLSALACILLFHRLARALVGPPALWATAMLVLGPAFIVEQNLMVDVPLLALWLAFFNALICEIDSPSQNRRYGLAAVACAAALLIKYSSLVLIPILCLSLLLERRKGQAWSLLIPLGALAGWSLFNFLDYGSVHIATRSEAARAGHFSLPQQAVAWVLALGAITPLGLIALVQGLRKLAGVGVEIAIYGATAAGFAALILSTASATMSGLSSQNLLWVVFLANGVLACLAPIPDVLSVVRARWWRPEVARACVPIVYLLSWMLGTTAFYIMFAPFIAARHVLLILPALTLVIVARWKGSPSGGSEIFGLALTVVVSAGLCLSDWRFADFYKVEADRVAQSLPAGATVWTSGHWGWQWYASRKGFRQIDILFSYMQAGDYLVVANDVDRQLPRTLPRMRLVRIDTQDHPLLNLFCTGTRFYASNHQAGPWSLRRDCIFRVTVVQIDGRAFSN
jgi:4-amino-4-deoxy-L-arabinose transferase-like glycosyltransferase